MPVTVNYTLTLTEEEITMILMNRLTNPKEEHMVLPNSEAIVVNSSVKTTKPGPGRNKFNRDNPRPCCGAPSQKHRRGCQLYNLAAKDRARYDEIRLGV